jgi:hypothetical protein
MPKYVASMTGDEFFVLDSSRYWYEKMKSEAQPVLISMHPDADHSSATAIPSLIPSMAAFMSNTATNRALPTISWSMDYDNGQIKVSIDKEWQTTSRTVQLWKSHTCEFEEPRRDFRMTNLDKQTLKHCRCGPAVPHKDGMCFNLMSSIWTNSTMTADSSLDASGNTYLASIKAPKKWEKRWDAFFVTVEFHDVAPGVTQDEQQGVEGRGGDSCKAHLIGGRETCLPFVQPGDIKISTQVMVLPDYAPFDCQGEGCLGTIM